MIIFFSDATEYAGTHSNCSQWAFRLIMLSTCKEKKCGHIHIGLTSILTIQCCTTQDYMNRSCSNKSLLCRHASPERSKSSCASKYTLLLPAHSARLIEVTERFNIERNTTGKCAVFAGVWSEALYQCNQEIEMCMVGTVV